MAGGGGGTAVPVRFERGGREGGGGGLTELVAGCFPSLRSGTSWNRLV